MNTQTVTVDLPANEAVYGMRELADTELDALLALEEMEIRGMQIADEEDLAELKGLISEDVLDALDACGEDEEWLLAS